MVKKTGINNRLIPLFLFSILYIYFHVVETVAPIQGSFSGKGQAGNGVIYYGDSFETKNLENPVEVMLTFTDLPDNELFTVNLCLSAFQEFLPISGINLETRCNTGSFSTLQIINSTTNTMISKHKLQRARSSSSSSSSNDMLLSHRVLSNMVDPQNSTQLSMFASKGASAALILTIPDSTQLLSFTYSLSFRYCEEGTYSVNGECEEITTIGTNTTSGAINLGGQSWQYIAIQIASLNQPNPTNLLNFTLSPSPTPPSIYIQQNYLPNSNFHLPILPIANNENNNNSSSNGGGGDGGGDQPSSLSLVVYFPGYFNESQWYYVGLYNPAVDSLSVNYTVIFGVCDNDGSGSGNSSNGDGSMFGPSCSFDPFNYVTANDELTTNDQMINIDVSSYLTLPPTSTDINFDNIFSFSFTNAAITSPPSFAYFVLTNLPNYTTPYYLRVSTANNAVNSAPPTFYAKFDGVPSPGSYDYNVTAQSSADIVSQISIPIYNTSDSQLWYLAIQLPSDFSIWILSNCANNCSNEVSNACYCSSGLTTVPCGNLTSYGTDPVGFTLFPTTLGDSAGVCTCNVGSTSSADDYKSYYDCRMYPPTTLYIIVGIILGALAISLCFLIPAYVYLSRKRQSARDDDYAPIS